MKRFAQGAVTALVAGWIALGCAGTVGAQATDMNQVLPNEDARAGNGPLAPPPWDRAAGVVLGLGSTMINAVVFPVKLVFGIAGAEVGGMAGALNGGDEEAAADVWHVTTDGSYFVTPQVLDGRGTFYYGGDSP